MADLKLSYTSALLLQTISAGYEYGFDIMDVTSLPSGTVVLMIRSGKLRKSRSRRATLPLTRTEEKERSR